MGAVWPLSLYFLALISGCEAATSWAIETQPSLDQITKAMERGQAAAASRTPPDRLYTWFGAERAGTQPHGFLMTKLDGLAVMSAHFGLRGLQASELEQDQILADPHLLVTVILFGARPDFLVDSYMLLLQGDRKISPVKVRFDGTADRSTAWPGPPPYRGKVVAFFAYTDFDPRAMTRVSVFPREGGEVSFEMDFASIP